MYRLSIQNMISGAHFLRGYKGNCSRLHGHNWTIQVEVICHEVNSAGMCIDFKELSDLSWQVISTFDHQNFNEIEPFDKINPTAENLAKYFYNEIGKTLPAGVTMAAIKLWETDKYMVEYSR